MKSYKCCNVYVCTLIIVLLGVSVSMHISECVIRDTNIVLTFVGILATFVVVGNYMQSEKAKEEFQNEIQKYKQENKEQNELLKHLAKQTKQYEVAQRIKKDIQTKNNEEKELWYYFGIKEDSDSVLIEEKVKIRNVIYENSTGKFLFDFCDDDGNEYKSQLKEAYYLVTRDLNGCYQCDLNDEYFRFLLRLELQNLGKVKK